MLPEQWTAPFFPHWYNLDEYDFQPAQNADATQESPTVPGISPWGWSGSSPGPTSTTSQASCNENHALYSISDRLSTKKFRQRRTKVCAGCKKSKTKCILGEGRTCLKCDLLGVRCNLPAARQLQEKELNGRSGRAPRQQCVSTIMREIDLLTTDI